MKPVVPTLDRQRGERIASRLEAVGAGWADGAVEVAWWRPIDGAIVIVLLAHAVCRAARTADDCDGVWDASSALAAQRVRGTLRAKKGSRAEVAVR